MEDEMFTNDEIELIGEALDALKNKAGSDWFNESMIGMILSKDSDESIKKSKAKFDAKKDDRQLLEDRITLLRAKLIGLRDKQLVDEVASSI
jgi:hypothetical protein